MRIAKAAVAVVCTMVILDLLWLGIVATDLYNDRLGDLRAEGR